MTDDIPAELHAALAPRFELRRTLGRGGMATVYLARDSRHQREVAVKVLRPDLAASVGTERFLAEIQIAARLTHPHILPMHDSGESRGFLYYVMPYLDEPSLRQRLVAEGRVPAAEALAIASGVADALTYAHRMGVVHRDIKPENILFAQGHPIVADFGIAKAVSTAGGPNLTRTGFPLGTPGYMSPEQAAGLTDLDARTDVYSLAVVVYEMLVGAAPGHWPSEDAVRTGRFLEAQPAHRSRLADAGPRVEGALVRAMAVQQERRTPTAAALFEELTGAAPRRRRYSEAEVQDIVKRAAEIEAVAPTAGGAMTMGGVEALAAEVGIAPEAVREAAQALAVRKAAPAPARRTRLHAVFGGPTHLVFERVVEGELDPAEFPVLVEEIRQQTENVGQVSQLGRSFSWNSAPGPSGTRSLEVAVTVRGGRTRIVVHENLSATAGAVYGGIGGGMGGAGMGLVTGAVMQTFNAPELLALVLPAWLLATFGVARTAYGKARTRRERKLTALADQLAAVTEELIPARPLLPRAEPLRT